MSHHDDEDMSAPGEFRPEWTLNGHVEEDSLYAWLDSAFDEADSAIVEQHVTSCAECSAAVAEARGYIAGAARIVRALDAVPRNVVPARELQQTAARIAVAAPPPNENAHNDAQDRLVRVISSDTFPIGKRPWYARSAFRAAAAVVVLIGGVTYVSRVADTGRIAPVADSSAVGSVALVTTAPVVAPKEMSPPVVTKVQPPVQPLVERPANRLDRQALPKVAANAVTGFEVRKGASEPGSAGVMATIQAAPAAAPAPPPMHALSERVTERAHDSIALTKAAAGAAMKDVADTAAVDTNSLALRTRVAMAASMAPRSGASATTTRSASATITIIGTVTDGKRPLGNAQVHALDAPQNSTLTDSVGHFVLRSVSRTSQIQAQFSDHVTSTMAVGAVERDTARLNIVLRPNNK